MRYTEAWASIAQQNLNLKRVTVLLAILSLLLGLISIRLTFKDELIFERGCFTKAVAKVQDSHSDSEVESFLMEALPQRFNSSVQPTDGYISQDELHLRSQEQTEFKSRSMTQMILVRSVKQNGDSFLVEADRIISAGDIRSAFRFPLKVKLESKVRSQSNPYGLLVVSIKPIEKESK